MTANDGLLGYEVSLVRAPHRTLRPLANLLRSRAQPHFLASDVDVRRSVRGKEAAPSRGASVGPRWLLTVSHGSKPCSDLQLGWPPSYRCTVAR